MKICRDGGAWFMKGGVQLFSQGRIPDNGVRAVLIMAHGIGEHGGCCQPMVQAMLARGFALHAFDLRGHGRLSGRCGLLNVWTEFREDLSAFTGEVRRRHSRLTRFLWPQHGWVGCPGICLASFRE